jgi:hypothetical protein
MTCANTGAGWASSRLARDKTKKTLANRIPKGGGPDARQNGKLTRGELFIGSPMFILICLNKSAPTRFKKTKSDQKAVRETVGLFLTM